MSTSVTSLIDHEFAKKRPVSHRSALAELRRRGAELLRQRFAPPPKRTVSEWADEHRVLPKGSTAEPGKWRTSRVPYLREIMDACSDIHVREVVFLKPSQIGATEALLNIIGYHIDGDPAPILLIQPTDKMGEAFSKDRLAPMLRHSPVLKGKIAEPKSRDSSNTLLHKVFPGGHVTITGANSPASLAMRPIRIVLCDEVDRYPPSAGGEGDPVSLAFKRAASFWNRKLVMTSTPTIAGVSRIAAAYDASDQRRYHVPCPHCGEYQPLRWKNDAGDYCLVWETDEDGTHHPETAQYCCQHCGALIPETAKPAMLEAGRWVPAFPDRSVVGFALNALYSPWVRWSEIATEFLEVKAYPERLRVFVNSVLGQTWEDTEHGDIDSASLAGRRESYGVEVPAGVGVLTAGVDIQVDRLELEIRGWGVGEESWLIAHHRIHGDPITEDPWERLLALLDRPYEHEHGGTLRVRTVCIDSGYQTATVYKFVAPRQRRGIYAAKGVPGPGRVLAHRALRMNEHRIKLITIGVDTAKDLLFARLQLEEPGPGYLHFCEAADDGADDEFMAQYGAERVVTRHLKGVAVREYRRIRKRNEAIDLYVLSLAALHLLGRGVTEHLEQWVAKAGAKKEEGSEPKPAPRQVRRRNWVTSW